MRIVVLANHEHGLTLIEVLVIIGVIAILACVFLPATEPNKARAERIMCVNNLKQCGLAFTIWEGNHGDKFPMDVVETNGGTAEFTSGPNLWRHFQVMSNELSTPKVLICPADSRLAATNFISLRNSNISYFVGLSATETDPQSILFGDRNITNGTPIRNGILELTTNHPAGWTSEMHRGVENIALADGSVQQVSTAGLRNGLANSGLTNRLQMPIVEQ